MSRLRYKAIPAAPTAGTATGVPQGGVMAPPRNVHSETPPSNDARGRVKAVAGSEESVCVGSKQPSAGRKDAGQGAKTYRWLTRVIHRSFLRRVLKHVSSETQNLEKDIL